ncbi:MAG: hypothetical protein KH013_01570, partial [Clostridiales bacterium]|nr:hypothetical protein [Clostridiales bacterium]
CALAKKCAGKPMVSCLMGDSTALASAIARCCLKSAKQKVILWKVVIPMQKERYHVDLVAFDVKNRKGALSMKKVILFSFDNVNGFF